MERVEKRAPNRCVHLTESMAPVKLRKERTSGQRTQRLMLNATESPVIGAMF